MKYWQAIKMGVVCCAASAYPAMAQTTASPPGMAWYAAGHVELQAADAEKSMAATWQFDRADNGDIRIIKDEQRGAEKITGSVLSVCDDRALAFKGYTPARDHELAELDQPVLVLQLALKLLARAFPQGPQSVTALGMAEIADNQNPLRVAKGPKVRREFGVPWQAQVRAESTGGDIKYSIALSYVPVGAKAKAEIKLSGIWRQSSLVHVWDNDTVLANQSVYRVEKLVEMVAGNALIKPDVFSQALEFDTLGALRARIERNWDANPKAQQHMTCGL